MQYIDGNDYYKERSCKRVKDYIMGLIMVIKTGLNQDLMTFLVQLSNLITLTIISL